MSLDLNELRVGVALRGAEGSVAYLSLSCTERLDGAHAGVDEQATAGLVQGGQLDQGVLPTRGEGALVVGATAPGGVLPVAVPGPVPTRTRQPDEEATTPGSVSQA